MVNAALVALGCGLLPAVTMSLGALAATRVSALITSSVKAATQYLSAGIIIGVVVGEIFPLLSLWLTDFATGLGLVFGFGLGVRLNVVLSRIDRRREDDDSSDEEDDSSSDDEPEAVSTPGNAAAVSINPPARVALGGDDGGGGCGGGALEVPRGCATLEDVLDSLAPAVFADGPPVPRLLDTLTREVRARGDRDAFDHAVHELEFVLHTLRRALRRRRDAQRRVERAAHRFSDQEVDRLQCHVVELKRDFARLRAVPAGADAFEKLKARRRARRVHARARQRGRLARALLSDRLCRLIAVRIPLAIVLSLSLPRALDHDAGG